MKSQYHGACVMAIIPKHGVDGFVPLSSMARRENRMRGIVAPLVTQRKAMRDRVMVGQNSIALVFVPISRISLAIECSDKEALSHSITNKHIKGPHLSRIDESSVVFVFPVWFSFSLSHSFHPQSPSICRRYLRFLFVSSSC